MKIIIFLKRLYYGISFITSDGLFKPARADPYPTTSSGLFFYTATFLP